MRAPYDETRDREIADLIGGGGVDGRNLWLDIEADQPVLEDGRREIEADAELRVGDAYLAVVFRSRDRELA